MRSLLTLPALLLVLATMEGCVSPVIPIPPPDPADLSFTITGPSQNQIVLKGAPDPERRGQLVFVLNQRTSSGLIGLASESDGSFQLPPLEAQDKDRLNLWTSTGVDDPTSSIACGVLDFASGKLTECH